MKVKSLVNTCIPLVKYHKTVVLPIELYFREEGLWKKCQFEDLSSVEIENGIKDYWPEYPDWLNVHNCVKSRQLSIFKYFHYHIDSGLINLIISTNGSLKVVKWMCENKKGPYHCDNGIIYYIAKKSHLKLIKWLYVNAVDVSTQFILNASAEFGRLRIIKWIYKNYKKDYQCCATDEISERAYFHHKYNILVWLIKNDAANLSYHVIYMIVATGNMNFIKLLCETKNKPVLDKLFDMAEELNKTKIIKMINKYNNMIG
jgi:hypothetical protein